MNIYCVGPINVDFIFVSEVWPAEHEKLRAQDYVCATGGSAANTAAELARLGRKVSMIGGVGTDFLGDFALERLLRAGVDTSLVLRNDRWKTGCAAIRSSGKTKSIMGAGFIDVRIVLEALRAVELSDGDHIHFSWTPSVELHEQIERWRQRGVSLSWETNGHMEIRAAHLMDVVFMNRDEWYKNELGGTLNTSWLKSPVTSVTVAITQGDTGAEAFLHGQRFFSRAPEIRVVDRTGGGDAFDAGFLHGWLDRLSLDVCLARGLDSAAAIIGKWGARYWSSDE